MTVISSVEIKEGFPAQRHLYTALQGMNEG